MTFNSCCNIVHERSSLRANSLEKSSFTHLTIIHTFTTESESPKPVFGARVLGGAQLVEDVDGGVGREAVKPPKEQGAVQI